MISTERVLGYTRLEPEAPLESKSKPPPDWPNKGHIELRNVEYRHSSNGPLVLKNMSLTITASEKVHAHYIYSDIYMYFTNVPIISLCCYVGWNCRTYWCRQVVSNSGFVQASRTKRKHQN